MKFRSEVNWKVVVQKTGLQFCIEERNIWINGKCQCKI